MRRRTRVDLSRSSGAPRATEATGSAEEAGEQGGRGIFRMKVLGAFTLLEVMVAVTILGISAVAIFSSEAMAIRAGNRARRMSVATLLARCKMGEIEEHLALEGFTETREASTDACCEDGEFEGFTCEWSVEPILLPDVVGEEGEDAPFDPLGGGGAAGGGPQGAPSTLGGASTSMEDALAGAAGGDFLGSVVMQYAFPLLKPVVEQHVRRAEVIVHWSEGQREQSLRVMQFLAADPGAATGNTNGDGDDDGSGGNP